MGTNEMDEIEKWLVGHPDGLDKYAGKWVAVTGRGVIASAKTFKELAAQKIVDEQKALMTKVPTVEESNAIWVLTQSVGRENVSL